jgi:hypothetical protein
MGKRQESAVNIVNGLGLGRGYSFLFCINIRIESGAQASFYPIGIDGSFCSAKLRASEADYVPRSTSNVKNACSYTSFSHTASCRRTQLS